jgi:hypothetical protein
MIKIECVFIEGLLSDYSENSYILGIVFIPKSQVFSIGTNGFWLSKWLADKNNAPYSNVKLFDRKEVFRHVPKKKEPIESQILNELKRC